MFRDIEISRLQHITELVRLRPFASSAIYMVILTVWTILISYGNALHGDYKMALQLSPHVTNFAVSIGFLVYPRQLRWIPVAASAVLFSIPFVLPFTGHTPWLLMPEVSLSVIGFFYAMNLISAAVPGLAILWVHERMLTRIRPYHLDLTIIAFIFGTTLLCCAAQIQALQLFAQTLSVAQLLALGFDDNLQSLVLNRGFQGAVTSAAFLLALLHTPSRAELRIAAPFALLYPLLAMAHQLGYGGYKIMDAALLSCLLALTLPVGAAPIVVLSGLALFVFMTGAFVTDYQMVTQLAPHVAFYAIIAMTLMALTLAMRGRDQHEREQRMASIRRLSTVRGFAGVGLFTLNVPRDDMRLDPAGQRLLGLPDRAQLADLVGCFRADEQYLLRHAIESESQASITLLLQLEETLDTGDNRVLRLHLWAETTLRDERVAYGLMVEVTEEHLQERALTDALNELSMRQDKQKQLFSIVSHEIRTPASVLSMLIDELETGQDLPEVRSQMREASTQLLSVLDDMRQAVNPEKNQPFSITPYVPADVAERVRNTYQILAKGKDIRISLELGAAANSAMMGDSNRLKQILGNLVRNAIIHSEGTEIRITYQPDNAGAGGKSGSRNCWRVTDDGVGIHLLDVERLFQPFERGSDDARNKAEGSGLGLYIAKQSVELLGGEIAYFDAVEGGAGYKIWLPDLPTTEEDMKMMTASKPQASKKLGELRVLLAEDNALVAQVTSKQLGRVFGHIELAQNGREALEMLRKNPPDILITDLFMPEMPGDELVRHVKAEGYTMPVIGLTAAVVGDDINRFEEAGATAVLPKPLDVKKLFALLDESFSV